MPSKADLKIYAGDDYAANVEVLNADDSPADLTGYTSQAHIRISAADKAAAPVAEFSVSIAGNVITMVLTHDKTKLLERATYAWDVQVIDGAGWITTLLAGAVAVGKEVTRVYAAEVTA